MTTPEQALKYAPATPGVSPDGQERTRSAWLANVRQDFLAPVRGIIEICEMVLQDAGDRGQEDFLTDLRKVQAAGQRFLALVNDVIDPAEIEADQAAFSSRVRHDLRTPLNHVIGYCDLWLEDAPERLLEGFAGDLNKLKDLAKQLLAHLEDILQLAQLSQAPSPASDSPNVPDMIRDLVRDVTAAPASVLAAADEKAAILVADDNEVNRDLLSKRLTREGHVVTVAADGHRALELLRQQRFDLVLLDLIMPGLNGMAVLDQMKADDCLRHVPVIMVSACDLIDGVVHCIERGAEDYLTKPFNPVLLKARINACLEKKRLRDREVLYLAQLEKERKRSDELLHVILPGDIVKELKETCQVQPRRYENVAVLFADIVGFTSFCDKSQPEQVVPYLQRLIETWEEIAYRHQVEKIKTIGDAFMAAAGLLQKPADGPVLACVRSGLEMIAATKQLPTGWDLRVGIHFGPVVAGVIGRRQYLFDLWGDTVNTAARMESHGVPGCVILSGTAWNEIEHCCLGETLSIVTVKGKGQMEMVRFDGFRT